MASSLSQIRVLCSTYIEDVKLSTRGREDYTGHENLYIFYSNGEPETEEILDGFPALASPRSARFFGLFLFSGQASSG